LSLSTLWRLQNLCLEKLDLERNLSKETEKELRQEKKKLMARIAELDKRQEELETQKRSLKKQEDRFSELTSKRKSAEENLYSGAVQNPKELENIQQQIELLKQEIDKCAEEFYQGTERIEQAVQKLEEERQVLEKEKKEYKQKVDSYLANKKQWETRLEKVQREIEELEKAVDPKLMLLYNDKKQKLGPRVLSSVENKACSACHMVIPSLILKEVKKGQEIIKCENCGRILYWK